MIKIIQYPYNEFHVLKVMTSENSLFRSLYLTLALLYCQIMWIRFVPGGKKGTLCRD